MLKIGLLAMPDSPVSARLIEELLAIGATIDFVIYWRPSSKEQLRRTIRKLRTSGLRMTCSRAYHALFGRFHKKTASTPKERNALQSYFVPGHNSDECVAILRREKPDVVFLATDALIRRRVFEIPRFGILNVHPGFAPAFRGLGSLQHMLEQGFAPALTLHQIDEGVDTGPVLARVVLTGSDWSPHEGLQPLAEAVLKAKARLIKWAADNLELGPLPVIDTFGEWSGLTRGFPRSREGALRAKLASNITLRSPNYFAPHTNRSGGGNSDATRLGDGILINTPRSFP